jgi:hypothetical protein
VEFPRALRFNAVLCLLASIIGAIEYFVGGDPSLIVGYPLIIFIFHVIPRWLVPFLFGWVATQRYLRVDDSGLHYGDKYHIPWRCITGGEHRRRLFGADEYVLIAAGWSGNGIMSLAARRRGLPLSGFDRTWNTHEDFVAVLKYHLSPDAVRSLALE